jgi:tetratricopeptide (TPR) repeat protein
MAFLEKYPKSTLKVYVVNAYETMLFELSKASDYQKLMQYSEQWLKLNPNDLKCQAYIFDCAVALGQHQKTVDFGEKVFAVQPSAKLALPIYQAYEKLGNKAKREEWALKLLQFPEYANDIQLRMQLVVDYADKDLAKSASYADQTLKAIPNAQKPAAMQDGEWGKALTSVKRTCYDIVGMHNFKEKKYDAVIQALTKANETVGRNILVEKYDSGFYYIGMSQWQQGNVEDAWLSFEVAAQIKGSLEAKAHKNAIDLYKSQRNGTEVGFNKVVTKALAILDAMIKGPA